ncbi:carbohydrate ABC transporter permease [Gorillibacterium massiliense]|uniref:carbohydrate ABC transporter permease n=1 Tax=Gorillibacterium massiliense TaxID=1280390 RepID=UPI0004B28D6C|nr:carbohydrate ABC transporter permease [Gorillibacterium massiliense]
MYHKTPAYRTFTVFNYLILGLAGLLCLLPLVHILAVSFSAKAPADNHLVGMIPVDFNWTSYQKTINNPNFVHALGISVFRTILGVSITMFEITLAAYALSKSKLEFRSRNIYLWFIVFTMLFSGGLIPSYLLIRKLHLVNTIWALVLPQSVAVFSLILLMNFFRATPKELEESAMIEGAGYFRTLVRVVLPISLPSLATMTLLSIVGNWNEWFSGLIYINDYRNYPMATFLQTIIVQQDFSKINPNATEMALISTRTVKSAQIFIAMLPVLMVYPFLQRYFVTGLVLGAVKE